VLFHPERPLGHFATFPRFRPHAALLDHLPFTPVSVSAFGPVERIHALAQRLREWLRDSASIIESGSEDLWGVEVFAPGVSKQLGLETVAAHLDVDREEIMAIGDHGQRSGDAALGGHRGCDGKRPAADPGRRRLGHRSPGRRRRRAGDRTVYSFRRAIARA